MIDFLFGLWIFCVSFTLCLLCRELFVPFLRLISPCEKPRGKAAFRVWQMKCVLWQGVFAVMWRLARSPVSPRPHRQRQWRRRLRRKPRTGLGDAVLLRAARPFPRLHSALLRSWWNSRPISLYSADAKRLMNRRPF